MSWKKKKKIEKMNTKIIEAISGLIIILLVLVWLLGSKLSGRWKTEVYKIEPRTTNVADVKIEKESDYSAIGWLRVQGTNIDFPIIQNTDEDQDFPVQLESFLWSLNSDSKFHNRIRVTGHNIFNLSSHPELKSSQFTRFESLMSFIYYDFAKENEYVQLTIDGNEYMYKIFMVGFVPSSMTVWFPIGDDYSKEDMKKYLGLFDKYNFYKYDVDVADDDYIITLNTCTRFYGLNRDVELYVLGRRLRDGEKATSYGVTTTDAYKEIETILKGDESNAEENM